MSEPLKVAMIGCGVVGGGMARRLLTLGHEVLAFDVRLEAMEAVEQHGAQPTASAAEAASGAEACVVSLPRREQVHDCFTGAGGLLEGLREGQLILETSTVPPAVVTDLEPAVRSLGARLLDAALCPAPGADALLDPRMDEGRGEDDEGWQNLAGLGAGAGQLCFFVGGQEAAVADATPLLEALSAAHHHVGPIGAGKTVKLLHNAINLGAAALISEMLVTAEAHGLDLRTVIGALKDSLADSRMLRSQFDRFVVPRTFPKGMFPIDYGLKDLSYALDLAAEVGAERSVLASAADVFRAASDAGYGEHYTPTVFKAVGDRREQATGDG